MWAVTVSFKNINVKIQEMLWRCSRLKETKGIWTTDTIPNPGWNIVLKGEKIPQWALLNQLTKLKYRWEIFKNIYINIKYTELIIILSYIKNILIFRKYSFKYFNNLLLNGLKKIKNIGNRDGDGNGDGGEGIV